MLEGTSFDVAGVGGNVPLVSIVVPVFNEQDTIARFISEIEATIASAWDEAAGDKPPCFEIIFVDDGSRDDTSRVVREFCRTNPRIKLICLSRNFGKESALSAGMRVATGDAVIPMDVDLQDPPDLLRPMIDQWRAGAQVVNARRVDRSSDTAIKRSSARAFYKVINSLADHPIEPDVGDFRLLDRAAVNALNRLGEHNRFNKGLFSWIGFQSVTLEYTRPARSAGTSKWKASKLVGLALDGVISSTTLPLRIWTAIGASIACIAFIYAGYLIVNTLVWGADTPGYASLMVAILFLGGLNLVSLGLLGEYIGRIATQVRGRPLYIISDSVGF